MVNTKNLRTQLKESLATGRKTQKFVQLLIKQQEDDRREISRELHDEIAQLLTGINFELTVLSKAAGQSGQRLLDKIANTQILVRESVEVIHRFARQLRPLILDDLGLVPALKSYIKEFMKQNEIAVELNISNNISKLNDFNQTVLFRVAQEALTNISKHAKATKVVIDLKKINRMLQLEIADNGKSFKIKTQTNLKKHRGMGLLIMDERVKMADGVFQIIAKPKVGTKISAIIPFRKVII